MVPLYCTSHLVADSDMIGNQVKYGVLRKAEKEGNEVVVHGAHARRRWRLIYGPTLLQGFPDILRTRSSDPDRNLSSVLFHCPNHA